MLTLGSGSLRVRILNGADPKTSRVCLPHIIGILSSVGGGSVVALIIARIFAALLV